MKNIRNLSLFAAVALTALGASAVDLSQLADLRFAEEYAFSTNRAETIARLKPNTKGWFAYTLLDLQTSGRIREARDFAKRFWHTGQFRDIYEIDGLHCRQDLLEWDAKLNRNLSAAVGSFLCAPIYVREVPLAPNTYASALDPKRISFAAFAGKKGFLENLKGDFAFLALSPECAKIARSTPRLRTDCAYPPSAPGFYEAVVAYLKADERSHAFTSEPAFASLTLDQLRRLQEEFKDDARRDLRKNAAFVEMMIRKLGPGADEGGAEDAAAEGRRLARVIGFLRTLPRSERDARLVPVLRDALALGARRGDYAAGRELLKEFLSYRSEWRGAAESARSLVREYLAAYRRAGESLADFAELVEAATLERVIAETDLLAGKDAATVKVAAFSDAEYRALVERVDLDWCAGNPDRFAADAEVALAIDVKNVPRMRLAIYDLDPFEAMLKSGAEVKGDLDLDGCVPSVERTLDYSALPAIRRHREVLPLPELKRPGLYVVECSGAGKCSRALIRKGRLHLARRTGAAGTVFTAFDDGGRVVKGARLAYGSAIVKADANGEMCVPFAAENPEELTVVVGAGRLAARETFRREAESYSLGLEGVLPQECAIAGGKASLALRPTLTVAGARASVALLKDVRLTVTLADADGGESVRTLENFALADDAEAVYAFTVPERLVAVTAHLSAKVANVAKGRDESLDAATSFKFNSILASTEIAQEILRRGSDGYVLELRGRNGEPLGSRAVTLHFHHRAFKTPLTLTLQADEKGLVALGELPDIERLSLDRPFAHEWSLREDWTASLPETLSLAEGETLELPAHDILAGAWPGANAIRARLSLCAVNAAGECIGDLTDALAVTNGVIRSRPLAAGDYAFAFLAERRAIALRVTRPVGQTVEGGLVVGARRGLARPAAPRFLRIESVKVEDGRLSVALANCGEETRVHVIARRALPDVTDPSAHAFETLARAAIERPDAEERRWPDDAAKYVSGRNLGDEIRYVLDRRNLPHRPGNLLALPSLLLAPWSEKLTETRELVADVGAGWARDAAENGARYLSAGAQKRGMAAGGDASCREIFSQNSDFLLNPAEMWTNLRPGKDGVVTLELPDGLEAQHFTVYALDAEGADVATAQGGKVVRCAKRDLRFRADATPLRAREKSYRTVGELYALFAALSPSSPLAVSAPLGEFAFVTRWPKLSAAEKRERYGEYASHELDLFLCFKDRAFFDAVVVPHLRNKRLKDFIDKALLGEDLSAYAAPGRFQRLDSLERCLLARRHPEFAEMVARDLADACAAHPVAAEEEDRLLAVALGLDERSERENASCCFACAPAAECAEAEEDDDFACETADCEPDEDILGSARAESKSKARGAKRFEPSLRQRRVADVRHRAARIPYRPPQPTREWRETYGYRRGFGERAWFAGDAFWRDYAAAIAKGTDGDFRSTGAMYAYGGRTEALAALAVTALPFEATEKGPAVTFVEPPVADATDDAKEIGVLQRFVEHDDADRADGDWVRQERFVSDEFVAGREYTLRTIVTNPSDRRRMLDVAWQLPEGALPLGCGKPHGVVRVPTDPYAVEWLDFSFYFPAAGENLGKLVPATVAERGRALGRGEPFVCKVVAAATKEDRASWQWISQRGTDAETLGFLAKANLREDAVDLAKIGWRMKDRDFRNRALEVLSSRGVFHEGLWRTVLLEGGEGSAEAVARLRELLAHMVAGGRLAKQLGPSFRSSLVDVDPEETNVFEHREYWPLVNARSHRLGAQATIANRELETRYRAFLDTLATKAAPTPKDRLTAAVYLLAQSRVDEAKAMVAGVRPDDVETRLQLDYLNAYLAFSDSQPEAARAIAAKYADWPVALWRERFRDVVAQADEIAGCGPAAGGEDAATCEPSLELRAEESRKGGIDAVFVRGRNVAECTLKAYPTDIELTFSKTPFGTAARGAATYLRPAWERTVELGADAATRVALPTELLRGNFILEAVSPEGEARTSLAVNAGSLDVQVREASGRLRVRDREGRALAGAYVKVYAQGVGGSETKFHKDGYTDLRGEFDYASISTDSPFRPERFAILVIHDQAGAKTLEATAP